MKKTNLLLAVFLATATVGGIGSKALLQPLPPSGGAEGKPPLPSSGQGEKPALPDREALVEMAANLVVEKFQNMSCEDLTQMQPSDKSAQAENGQQAAMQKKAIALLKENPSRGDNRRESA